MNQKSNLLGLKEEHLIDFFSSLGEEKYRAHQLMDWIYKKGVNSFDLMSNFPKDLREKLKIKACIEGLVPLCEQSSKDGSIKYLLALSDGETIESVVMNYSHGHILCVSSQVGCRMGCRFCASGIGGRVRNLESGEIMAQVLFVQNELKKRDKGLKGIVLMGSGEPLDNFTNVLDFFCLVSSHRGFNMSLRHITLSTCGLAEKIKKLADYNYPVTLSVSLHAPTDSLRNQIMPVNRKYPLKELMESCHYYVRKTGSRITFDYLLIDNFNAGKVYAYKLANLIKKINCHVNLIPFNPVKDFNYKPPSKNIVQAFKESLEKQSIPVTVRRSLGRDIDAACGQLRRRSYRQSKGGDY